MNTIKSLLTVALVTLAFASGARAASSSPKDLGVTNVLALSATQTANMGTYADLRNWSDVSMLLTFYPAALGDGSAATANVTVTFCRTTGDPSASTTLWDTANRFTWAVPANGTNVVVGVTNLPRDTISGITGLKVVSIQNGTTNRLDGVKLLITAKGYNP